MIKAVIFDLDGTLIDTEKAILGAYHHVFTKYSVTYDEKMIRTYIGRTLEYSYGELIPDQDPNKLAILHRDWQIERIHLVREFAGLKQLLDYLTKKDLKLGIFTSSSRLRTDAIFEALGLTKYFIAVLCGNEVTNPKPHQEGVEVVAKKLDVSLDEVIFVGDSEHDIRSGKNAGVTTIGVTHGFGTIEALKKAGADYLVENLKEIRNLLQKIIK